MADKAAGKEKDKSKVHKLSLKGSAKLVAEFVSSHSRASFPAIHVCPSRMPVSRSSLVCTCGRGRMRVQLVSVSAPCHWTAIDLPLTTC